MTNPQAYRHYSKHSYVTEVRNASCWRCMWPYVNFILFTCSTGRQGMTGATRGRGEDSVDSEGFAGQWWSIPCSGATINYVTANDQATKGFPKIGGSCPRSENKWPKSQRGRTVFLTCGHYRDARSAEMKHDVLGLEAGSGYSIKTLKCTGRQWIRKGRCNEQWRAGCLNRMSLTWRKGNLSGLSFLSSQELKWIWMMALSV